MILSIGEILADLIGEKNDGALTFRVFCGGAPFNLAVNAKQSGATVGFVGRVGNDVIASSRRKQKKQTLTALTFRRTKNATRRLLS